MEISRLFSSGTPDLHLANFLHMITTMAESGSNEEQTEFFILNSQKMPKLPAGESVWSLAIVPLSADSETGMMSSSRTIDEKNPVKIKKRPGIISNWPPTDWKSAPGFRRSSVCVAKSEAARGIQSKEETVEEIVIKIRELPPTEMTCVENADNGPAADAVVVGSQDADHLCNVLVPITMKEAFDSSHPMTEPQDVNYSSSDVTERDQLYVGTTDAQWETVRLGTNETGLPYDLVVGDDEYIEERQLE